MARQACSCWVDTVRTGEGGGQPNQLSSPGRLRPYSRYTLTRILPLVTGHIQGLRKGAYRVCSCTPCSGTKEPNQMQSSVPLSETMTPGHEWRGIICSIKIFATVSTDFDWVANDYGQYESKSDVYDV